MGSAVLLVFFLLSIARCVNGASDISITPVAVSSGSMSRYQGIVVDSIEIENRNIFDADSGQYHHFVFRLANKLHYKTRTNVIRREILVKVGEPFSPELAAETARNLRQRLSIFDAWVEPQMLANGHLLVRVVTIDEWSLSGGLDLNREGNETQYRLVATEKNLLGNNQFLSMEYFVEPSDEDYVVARFMDARFFGAPCAVEVGYGDDPLGKFHRVSFGHPFYNLSQAYSFDITITGTSGRREIHSNSSLIGRSNSEGDQFGIRGSYRIGSYYRKLQINPQYIYRYERTFDRTVLRVSPNDTLLAEAGFPADSMYHQVGLSVRLANLDFITLRQVDGFGYTEDFVLGQALRVGFARALTGKFRDYVFDLFDVGFSQGFHHGPNLAFLTYYRALWFREDRNIRRMARLGLNYYYAATDFLTIATRGRYMSDSKASSAESVVVGGRGEIRGFDETFKTGDRKAVFNLEGRFYPNVKILSVLFAPVLFADVARSWKTGEKVGLKDFYMSGGIGLRIAFERSSKNRLLRIDAAYSDKNGWQLSIGVDQYFKAQHDSFLLTTR